MRRQKYNIMKTLTVTLKQHTPLIHFQHDQYGATLRASEVKPKLDRFILTKLGGGDYEEGKETARRNGWLIGEKNALNYKMSIVPYEKKDVSLKVVDGQYTTEQFPMILSNMGGKEDESDLVNLSLYNHVIMKLVIMVDSLESLLRKYLALFFARTNFGQRQTKGFGSFTVYKYNNEKAIEWNAKDYYEEGCPYMAFAFEGQDTHRPLTEKQKQEKLFAVLDFYWKCLKPGVNYTRGHEDGVYASRYIKSYLYCFLNKFRNETWEKRRIKQTFHLGKERKNVAPNPNNPIFARGFLGCPDKYSYGNREVKVEHNTNDENIKIDRIPTPIYFKPICFGNICYVYILFDVSVTSNIIRIPKGQREFKFSYNGNNFKLDLKLFINSKNYKDFINFYHEHLSSDKDVLEALYTNSSKEDYVDLNGDIMQEDDLGFVPRDFNWNDILKDKNGVIFNNVE